LQDIKYVRKDDPRADNIDIINISRRYIRTDIRNVIISVIEGKSNNISITSFT